MCIFWPHAQFPFPTLMPPEAIQVYYWPSWNCVSCGDPVQRHHQIYHCHWEANLSGTFPHLMQDRNEWQSAWPIGIQSKNNSTEIRGVSKTMLWAKNHPSSGSGKWNDRDKEYLATPKQARREKPGKHLAIIFPVNTRPLPYTAWWKCILKAHTKQRHIKLGDKRK